MMKLKTNGMPGVEIEKRHNSLDIRLSCLENKFYSTNRFVITGGLVLFVVSVASGFALTTPLLSIGGSVVLMIAGMTAARAAKTTHIHVMPDRIEVKGKSVSSIGHIQQVCPEFSGEANHTVWYKITAITDSGKTVTVIDHLSERRAQYVAEVMQNFLDFRK